MSDAWSLRRYLLAAVAHGQSQRELRGHENDSQPMQRDADLIETAGLRPRLGLGPRRNFDILAHVPVLLGARANAAFGEEIESERDYSSINIDVNDS
jgi:hypothetical protein